MPAIKNSQRRSNGVAVEVASVLGSGTSKISKKIRDIERLLSKRRDKLPANVIVENERALAALRIEKKNATKIQQVKKNAKKYHMVRFFEKKKALRKYKQAKKEYDQLISSNSEKKEIKKAKKKLSHCEIDLAYVVYFPKSCKYIALYPTNSSESEKDETLRKGLLKTEAERNQYKKQYEQMIKDGSILVEDILKGETAATQQSIQDQEDEAPDAAQEQDDAEDDFFE